MHTVPDPNVHGVCLRAELSRQLEAAIEEQRATAPPAVTINLNINLDEQHTIQCARVPCQQHCTELPG